MAIITDIYPLMIEKAQKHEYLHHFTGLDKFELIISGQKLLLNRLDRVEDKTENEMLPDLWNRKVFVACFTHSNKGKHRFWNEYAKGNGVRISFKNDILTSEHFKLISQGKNIFTKRTKTDINYKSYNKFDDWGYFDISKVDIQYCDQSEIHQWQDKGNGLVKEEKYSWEEETRIRVAMDPLGWENILNNSNKFEVVRPFFETLYMQLSEAMLKSMYISVPEHASEEFILKVKSILGACEHTNNCPIYRLCENGEIRDIIEKSKICSSSN